MFGQIDKWLGKFLIRLRKQLAPNAPVPLLPVRRPNASDAASRTIEGEASQGRLEAEGTGLHKRSAEDREEAAAGRMSRSLTGRGFLQKRLSEEHSSAAEGVNQGRRPTREGCGRGAMLVAESDRSYKERAPC